MSRRKLIRLAGVAAAASAVLAVAACGSSGSTGATPTQLSLVGFAVPKAGNDAVRALWGKTPDGAGVTWTTSYGASGDQSRAVAAGLKADLVHFSITPDVTRLVDAKLVADTWDDGPTKGILTDSVVVLVVRKGNPKNIKGWDDIVKPGVGIVTPNPGSSGAARWNILAAWGHVTANGGSEADATAFLTKFFQNTVALPGSGRDATTAFQGGTGDVLISYENEAILARQNNADFDYIIPDTTLLIENPAAVTVGSNPKAATFLTYALSKDGQTAYAEKGFRPLDKSVSVTVTGANDPANPFPAPKKLLTIDTDFQGWSAVSKKYFDTTNGIITKIQQQTGKS
ncbi:MAG: sulfate ABC transporter substrate-binding protein [Actinomycetota bacterium]|nr:MAG: sulfate ABC transporter substrate-binding protein [Actinomycetota bacterium]